MDSSTLSAKKCIPCTKNTASLDNAQVQFYLNLLPNWHLQNNKLEKEVKTKNFQQSLDLANQIGELAEEENHHPDILVTWGLLKISLYTHAIQGLSDNDFILAAKLDKLIDSDSKGYSPSKPQR